MNIKFLNEKEFEYLSAIPSTKRDGSTVRNVIEVKADISAITYDELSNLLKNEENTAEIILTNTEWPVLDENGKSTGEVMTVTETLYDYVILNSIKTGRELVSPETSESPAVYTEYIWFELWQKTYIEKQLAKLGL